MKNPVIITGATGSMGAVAVKAKAEEGYPVIMACRNLQKAAKVRDGILASVPDARLEIMHLDLSSQASVREFADSVKSWLAPGVSGFTALSGLFNNAGVISREYRILEDGYEQTMAVNCINPALLTMRLLPLFEEGAHIVNMVSLTTRCSRIGKNWMHVRKSSFSQLGTYGKSKLAFLLFSAELGRRCPWIHVNVSDPGIVDSDMITLGHWFDSLADKVFRPLISSPEKGVRPALAALDTDLTMRYFVGGRNHKYPSRVMRRTELVSFLFDSVQPE